MSAWAVVRRTSPNASAMWPWLAAALFSVGGCSAKLSPLGTSDNPVQPIGPVVDASQPGRCAPEPTAVSKLLRVSTEQYQLMVSDLLGASVPGETFINWTPISQVYGFDTLSEARIDAQALEEQYETV